MAEKSTTFEFGTAALDKAIDGVCGFLKSSKDKASAELGTCFKKYLKNAYENYNNVKTLVSRDTPREIIGKDSIYVSVGVEYGWREDISTETVEPLLKLSKHILVEGTGGAGKTMLMKHFFVNTVYNELYIPVFVRLNKISEQPNDDISIYNLIYSAIKEFSDDVSDEAFKHSLKKGKYLFLFDGFDEIAGTHSIDASIAINDFCKKYPDNPCIVTSRPDDLTQFKCFTFVEMMDLNKEQAIELTSKLGMDDEKTKEFCRQLDEKLFDDFHNKKDSFAENPLLLSMMFLTFLENGSVPDRIVDFYDRTYNALYNNHDNFKDGYFKRAFESSLTPDEFKKVFSHFCFQTYMAQKYNFTKEEIIEQIKKSMNKCGVDEAQAESYLNDLMKAVCLVIQEGTSYVFAHRSFQTYFAALYTGKLDDVKQKQLFNNLLLKERYSAKGDYYEILIQLMGERFAINALEDKMRSLNLNPPYTDDFMLKLAKDFNLLIDFLGKEKVVIFCETYLHNCASLFEIYKNTGLYFQFTPFLNEEIEKRIKELLKKVSGREYFDLVFSYLEKSDKLTEDEKREFWLLVIKESKLYQFLIEIHNWLNSLDEKRKKLEESAESKNWYEEF